MRNKRFWACWKREPRRADLSPCGYLENISDGACEGCADSPRTARTREIEAAVRVTASAWARRWKVE